MIVSCIAEYGNKEHKYSYGFTRSIFRQLEHAMVQQQTPSTRSIQSKQEKDQLVDASGQ